MAEVTPALLPHGPLSGIKVVDLTVAIQGPHATAFLADMWTQAWEIAHSSMSTAEWTAFLAAQPEIIYERIQDYQELLEDPQVAANDYLAEVEVPGFGVGRVVTNVVRLSDTPTAAIRRRAPLLGEHTAEVMTELGFNADEIDQVLASGESAVRAMINTVFGRGDD